MAKNANNDRPTCATAGQVLSDNRVIDVVSQPSGDLALAVYDGEKVEIVPKLTHEDITYIPRMPHPSVRAAMHFPSRIADQVHLQPVFMKMVQLFCTYVAMLEPAAFLSAACVIAGWVWECFEALPIVCLTGANLGAATRLFRLLSAVSRRALILGNITFQVPMELHPTLLILHSGLSQKQLTTLRACSQRGVYLPSARGELKAMDCAKAIYSEKDDLGRSWGDEAVCIGLLPQNSPVQLSDGALDAIADEFQPQLELFRLRRLYSRTKVHEGSCPADFAGSNFTRELWQLMRDEPEMPKLIQSIAEEQRESIAARRALDPLTAILESIWMPSHNESQITMTDLQQRVNTLLQSRGERVEFGTREIGWKAKGLDLARERSAQGKILRFSSEIRAHIHRLARQFGLTLQQVHGCADCAAMKKLAP